MIKSVLNLYEKFPIGTLFKFDFLLNPPINITHAKYLEDKIWVSLGEAEVIIGTGITELKSFSSKGICYIRASWLEWAKILG